MPSKATSLLTSIALWAVLVLFTYQANSQYTFKPYNLVPNPSFEFTTSCNIRDQNIFLAYPWFSPTNDSNYFAVYLNSCSLDSNFGIPFHIYNYLYKYPHTGNAMTIIYLWQRNFPDTRSYLQTHLNDTLKANRKYYIECFTQNVQLSINYCNNLSIYLSNKKDTANLNTNINGLIPANAQIQAYGNPVITDTQQWVKIAGIYQAKGGEQFITIGNFKPDSKLTLIPTNYKIRYTGASYYIDDVSVIPLDSIQLQADAGRDTTITKGDSAFIGTLINGLDTLKWQVLVNGQVIDTIRPGFWVKPTVNTCYVLTQTVNGYTSSDTVCVYVNALPVKFVSLSVSPSPPLEGSGVVNKEVNIKFSTANEINVSHYNIQYSLNGKDFKTTGNPIPAKGGNLNEYMVSNSPPLEGLGVVEGVVNNLVYYRIQATDHDGQQTFSEIKSIKLNAAGVVSIYPNPANNEVTVTGKNIQQISISDVAGKTIISSNNKKINISSLPNGTYFISIKTTDNYEVQKLVKW